MASGFKASKVLTVASNCCFVSLHNELQHELIVGREFLALVDGKLMPFWRVLLYRTM